MLEKTLERIAEALEQLVDVARAGVMATPADPQPQKVTPGARKPGGKRATKKSEGVKTSKEDFHEDAAKADAKTALGDGEPVLTLEEVRENVRQYAAAFGGDAAVAKIIKYGAKEEKPLIADVDRRQYKALVDELQGEIANG